MEVKQNKAHKIFLLHGTRLLKQDYPREPNHVKIFFIYTFHLILEVSIDSANAVIFLILKQRVSDSLLSSNVLELKVLYRRQSF